MTANLELTRLSEKLGLTPSELAKLVGIARNTLRAKSATRKVDAALRSITRILATATEMAGDEGRAAIWFKHQLMSWPTWRLFAPGSMLEPVDGDPDGRLPTSAGSVSGAVEPNRAGGLAQCSHGARGSHSRC